jgi:adenylosuccinate lyase
MKYRVYVELQWFKCLFEEKIVTQDAKLVDKVKDSNEWLDSVFEQFSVEDGERVKEIERTTNHDVKAIEYFLKEKFEQNE